MSYTTEATPAGSTVTTRDGTKPGGFAALSEEGFEALFADPFDLVAGVGDESPVTAPLGAEPARADKRIEGPSALPTHEGDGLSPFP